GLSNLPGSDLLAQGPLRVEPLALARLGGRLAAHRHHDVEEIPRVLHGGGRLALAEEHFLDVDVVAGADLLGALQVLELPALERARDLLGVGRLHLPRGVEQDAHRRVGRGGVAARGALARREVAVAGAPWPPGARAAPAAPPHGPRRES